MLSSGILSLSAKKVDFGAVNEIIKNEKTLDLDAEYDEKPVEFSGGDCMNCK